MNAEEKRPDQTVLIAGAWALVGIPLAYGLYNAIQAAAKLFTG